MSLIDTARDALKDLPISDIVRERLSLTLDRLTDAEAKIETLQTEKGSLHAQLERERADHKQAREELQRLKDEHAEEVVIHRSIEFRRGKRTRGQWAPFCPKCHMPVEATEDFKATCNGCGWYCDVERHELARILKEL